MFLDRVIHFGETLGDSVKGRSQIKLKTIIEVHIVIEVSREVVSITMILIPSHSRVLKASYPFAGKFGR